MCVCVRASAPFWHTTLARSRAAEPWPRPQAEKKQR